MRYTFYDKTGAIIVAVPVTANHCKSHEAAQHRDPADEGR